MPLSKTKIKQFHSLLRKKTRDELGLFIAEGEKLAEQLIKGGFVVDTLVTTSDLLENYKSVKGDKVEATASEIKKISSQKTPQNVIAIFKKPEQAAELPFGDQLTLSLDSIQDPGNLGTIIRLASWFGIKNVVCSKTTADCYSPKVIQATMGAFVNVNLFYTDLGNYLSEARKLDIPVYGTFLNGDNIYQQTLTPNGIIVMGNEGNGISAEIEKLVTHRLYIPSFALDGKNVESLNVSVATAIFCSEFKRNTT